MNNSAAKQYNRRKLQLLLLGLAIQLLLWLALLLSPLNHRLADLARECSSRPLFQFYCFLALLAGLAGLLFFPLNFYSDYLLEKKFNLSNQNVTGWLAEQLKSLLVGLILGGIVLTVLYHLLSAFPNSWWFWIWLFLLIFGVLLTHLAPVVLFPLFYRFEPLDNPELLNRFRTLAEKFNFKLEGVYRFNLSKTTRKANAALVGLGRNKRVILGDTLLEHFTAEEITTIFAHELGHSVHRHIPRLIAWGAGTSLVGLFLVQLAYRQVLFHHHWGTTQLEALPFLGFFLFLYGTVSEPLNNWFSRRLEYQADAFAVRLTGAGAPFTQALEKLAALNLADRTPSKIVETLYHSHPSIENRIRKIKQENYHGS